jgi:hypothetical protein
VRFRRHGRERLLQPDERLDFGHIVDVIPKYSYDFDAWPSRARVDPSGLRALGLSGPDRIFRGDRKF